jgi:HlyD family secretion protein
VQRGPLEQDVVDQGRARVRERYTVSAPVAGTLARIEVHEGDAVEPGTVLARLLPLASPLLDPESRRAAEQRLGAALDGSEQAKATALRAQLASESAESELVRATALAKRGAVVAADLDRATSAAKMQEAELASARFAAKVAAHEIDVARLALARFTPGASRSEELVVTSPVHGQVLHVLHRSEGVVSPGEPLLEVGDPAAIELVADVLSADAAAIEPGMTARVDHWGGPHSLVAKVRRVEPAAFTKISALGVDEQRVNVLLDLQGPPAEWRGLGDGFSAEIAIAVWSKPDAIQAPTSTLFRRNDAWSVFVVEDGRARERAVSPTHRGPLQTEVERGLAPDDVVILHPGGAVRDGSRVAFR